MQATIVQEPGVPGAPAAPIPPAPVVGGPPGVPTAVVVTNADGTTLTLAVPRTKAEVANIRARRSELSSQLSSAEGRRRRLAKELDGQPPGPARVGLEGRLAVLDTRLAQLEADIAATGRQLSEAPDGLVTLEKTAPEGDMPDNVLALSIVVTMFVLFPLALTLARNLWKRGNRVVTQSSPETDQRLERLEQGVEAIAIEIERVSEGQRFVTRLLSEGAPAGQLAQSEHVADKV